MKPLFGIQQYRVRVGDVLPDIVGGLTSFSYKSWDLSLALTFQLGGDIYDSSSKRQLGVVTDWNFHRSYYRPLARTWR